jgi:hypothetical protein
MTFWAQILAPIRWKRIVGDADGGAGPGA